MTAYPSPTLKFAVWRGVEHQRKTVEGLPTIRELSISVLLDAGFGGHCFSSDSQLTITSRYAIADPEGGIITRNRLPSGDNCQRWLSLL